MAAAVIAQNLGCRKFHPISSSSSLSNRLVPCPPDLISWVRRQGGFVHKGLRIANVGNNGSSSSSGLELVCKEEIPSGSELIALPKHVSLSFGHAHVAQDASHAVLLELASEIPDELWALKLGLKLLKERSTVGSFWWPHISNFPEAFGTPIFFSGEEIKSLQYAPLINQINKRCRFLLDFGEEVQNKLEKIAAKDHPFNGQEVTVSSLGWAMSAVSSRAFRLHGIPVILPLVDMCNHSFHANAAIVPEEDTNDGDMLVKVIATKEIQQNSSVTLNYGLLINDLLLLDYGFVDPQNPFDAIELKYDGALLDAGSFAAGVMTANFSSPTKWQQEMLQKLKLEGPEVDLKVSLGGHEVVDGRLLAAARMLVTRDIGDLRGHELKTLQSLMERAPMGVSNEINALRTVIGVCLIALGHFETGMLEDEQLLKTGLSSSMRHAVEFRLRKKTLIVDVMRELTRRVNELSKVPA